MVRPRPDTFDEALAIIAELDFKLETAEERNVKLLETVESLSGQNSTLSAQIEDYERTIQELEEELKEKQRRSDIPTGSPAQRGASRLPKPRGTTSSSNSSTIDQKSSEDSAKLNELKLENLNLSKQLSELKTKNQILSQSNKELKATEQDRLSQREKLAAKSSTNLAKIKASNEENTKLKATISELTLELTKQKDTVTQLKNKNMSLTKKVTTNGGKNIKSVEGEMKALSIQHSKQLEDIDEQLRNIAKNFAIRFQSRKDGDMYTNIRGNIDRINAHIGSLTEQLADDANSSRSRSAMRSPGVKRNRSIVVSSPMSPFPEPTKNEFLKISTALYRSFEYSSKLLNTVIQYKSFATNVKAPLNRDRDTGVEMTRDVSFDGFRNIGSSAGANSSLNSNINMHAPSSRYYCLTYDIEKILRFMKHNLEKYSLRIRTDVYTGSEGGIMGINGSSRLANYAQEPISLNDTEVKEYPEIRDIVLSATARDQNARGKRGANGLELGFGTTNGEQGDGYGDSSGVLREDEANEVDTVGTGSGIKYGDHKNFDYGENVCVVPVNNIPQHEANKAHRSTTSRTGTTMNHPSPDTDRIIKTIEFKTKQTNDKLEMEIEKHSKTNSYSQHNSSDMPNTKEYNEEQERGRNEESSSDNHEDEGSSDGRDRNTDRHRTLKQGMKQSNTKNERQTDKGGKKRGGSSNTSRSINYIEDEVDVSDNVEEAHNSRFKGKRRQSGQTEGTKELQECYTNLAKMEAVEQHTAITLIRYVEEMCESLGVLTYDQLIDILRNADENEKEISPESVAESIKVTKDTYVRMFLAQTNNAGLTEMSPSAVALQEDVVANVENIEAFIESEECRQHMLENTNSDARDGFSVLRLNSSLLDSVSLLLDAAIVTITRLLENHFDLEREQLRQEMEHIKREKETLKPEIHKRITEDVAVLFVDALKLNKKDAQAAAQQLEKGIAEIFEANNRDREREQLDEEGNPVQAKSAEELIYDISSAFERAVDSVKQPNEGGETDAETETLLNEMRQNIGEMREEIRQLKEENDSLISKNKVLEVEAKEEQQHLLEAGSLKQQLEESEKRIKQLSEDVSQLNATCERLRNENDRLSEVEHNVGEDRRELEELQHEKEEAEKEVERTKDEVRKLQEELEQQQQQAREGREESDKSGKGNTENEAASGRAKLLQTQLAEMEGANTKLQDELKKLKSQLAQKGVEVETLEQQLKEKAKEERGSRRPPVDGLNEVPDAKQDQQPSQQQQQQPKQQSEECDHSVNTDTSGQASGEEEHSQTGESTTEATHNSGSEDREDSTAVAAADSRGSEDDAQQDFAPEDGQTRSSESPTDSFTDASPDTNLPIVNNTNTASGQPSFMLPTLRRMSLYTTPLARSITESRRVSLLDISADAFINMRSSGVGLGSMAATLTRHDASRTEDIPTYNGLVYSTTSRLGDYHLSSSGGKIGTYSKVLRQLERSGTQ